MARIDDFGTDAEKKAYLRGIQEAYGKAQQWQTREGFDMKSWGKVLTEMIEPFPLVE